VPLIRIALVDWVLGFGFSIWLRACDYHA